MIQKGMAPEGPGELHGMRRNGMVQRELCKI